MRIYETPLSRGLNYFLIALIMSNAAAVLLEVGAEVLMCCIKTFFIILKSFRSSFLASNIFYGFGQLLNL